jgi:hypothetical protein
MNDEPQQKPRSGITGKGFVKGDPRINRSGRPKSFEELRRAAQRIAGENVIDAGGNSLTRIDSILRQWSRSKQPALQLAFVAYAYGKPPEKIEAIGLENKPVLVLHYAHERPRLAPSVCRTLPDKGNGEKRLIGP